MSGRASRLFPLLHDSVKRVAPWSRFIGAPDFPTYWLYNEDTGFGRSEKVEVHYDSENNVEKVVGKNAALQEASIEFSWDGTAKKSIAVLKKGVTTELTIEEWFSEGETVKLYIDTRYADNSDYDVQIRITKPSSQVIDSFDVEVDINNKNLSGIIDLSSESVPQIAVDVINELNNMNSPATVAALEGNIIAALAVEAWEGGSSGSLSWQGILNIGGTAMALKFGLGVGVFYAMVCHELVEQSVAAS